MCKVFFIEGPDDSGKTTLIKNLSNYFKSNGRRVAIFREPDGEFRKMLLDKDSNLSFATRRALFAADHLQTLDTIYQSKDKYDYILIDCPPSLGHVTLNALTAADSVLLPLQCEFYALEGLSQLLSTVQLVQEQLNGDLRIEGLVLTMYDSRTNLAEQVVEEVKTHFPDMVYATKIPRNVRLSEAPSFGKPIFAYASSSKGAQAYMSLAEEVVANG